MSKPIIADNKPVKVHLSKGQEYHFCTCGRSSSQPFCDGSHQGSEFQPVKLEITERRKVWLCGCKHTQDQPFCDGSHSTLEG